MKISCFRYRQAPSRGHSWQGGMSRFSAAHLYGAVYNLHNSAQPSKVWCTHWLNWKTLLGSGKHINRKEYIFLLGLFWHVLPSRPLRAWILEWVRLFLWEPYFLKRAEGIFKRFLLRWARQLHSLPYCRGSGPWVPEMDRVSLKEETLHSMTQIVYVYVWEGKWDTDYSGSVSNVWELTDFPWIAKFVFISLIFLSVHVVSLEHVHHST